MLYKVALGGEFKNSFSGGIPSTITVANGTPASISGQQGYQGIKVTFTSSTNSIRIPFGSEDEGLPSFIIATISKALS